MNKKVVRFTLPLLKTIQVTIWEKESDYFPWLGIERRPNETSFRYYRRHKRNLLTLEICMVNRENQAWQFE